MLSSFFAAFANYKKSMKSLWHIYNSKYRFNLNTSIICYQEVVKNFSTTSLLDTGIAFVPVSVLVSFMTFTFFAISVFCDIFRDFRFVYGMFRDFRFLPTILFSISVLLTIFFAISVLPMILFAISVLPTIFFAIQ